MINQLTLVRAFRLALDLYVPLGGARPNRGTIVEFGKY